MTSMLVCLGDICDVRSGGTPSRGEATYYGGDIPWAKISDLEAANGTLHQTEETITEAGLKAIRGRLFPKGTLLFAIYGSIGKMAFAAQDVSANQAILGISIKREELLNPRYLYRFLQWRQPTFLTAGLGIAQKNLSAAYVRDIEVPLLPPPAQKRMAAILDQADDLRRKRIEAIRRLHRVGDALFGRMFADRASMPQQTIRTFADVKGGKRLPKGVDYAPGVTGHPYIRVSDLRNGTIATSGLKYITPDVQKKVARYIVDDGDLVISIAGTIGTLAPVPKTLSGANLTENAAKITPKKPGSFDATYLSWALRSPQAQQQIASRTGQVTIGKLALFRIEEITVPFPPVKKQREFAAGLRALEAEIQLAEKHLEKLDRMFASLQYRAFRGEL